MSKAYAQEALEQAYDAYAERLKSFCRVRLGEAAEAADDCVQETFLVYYKRLLGGEAFLHPRSFLYKTANVMVCKAREEYFKNAKRSESLEKAEQISVTMNAFDETDWDYDKLKALLLAQLTPAEQELYRMKYQDFMSLKEIGEALSITPSAAANRLARLRAKLKGMIAPVLDDCRKGGG